MPGFKKFFDRLFGVHPFLDNKHTWFHFMCLTFTVMCFFMYIDHMGEEHELKYGALVFLILCMDNLAAFWQNGRNPWQESSRFEDVILELTQILFLLIIPLISINQYYKSDLGCYYLGIVTLLPVLYLLPILRSKCGRCNLYVLILKASVFFNLLVSIRTTFFGNPPPPGGSETRLKSPCRRCLLRHGDTDIVVDAPPAQQGTPLRVPLLGRVPALPDPGQRPDPDLRRDHRPGRVREGGRLRGLLRAILLLRLNAEFFSMCEVIIFVLKNRVLYGYPVRSRVKYIFFPNTRKELF